MFFELRQYRIFPGKMAEWVKFMEETIIPRQVAKGFVIVGSFVGQEEDDLYVWIRRFASEEERAALQRAFYDTAEWRDELRPIAQTMNDFSRIVVAHRGDAEIGDPLAPCGAPGTSRKRSSQWPRKTYWCW